MFNRFFTIFLTQMADRSQTSTGLSKCGSKKVLTLPASVLLAKNNSVWFLEFKLKTNVLVFSIS